MQGKYFSVTLNCGPRNPPNDAIERALAQPYDWLRFSRDVYYVYAPPALPTAEGLYYQLKPLLHPDDLVLVTELNGAQRYGWVSSVAAEWFNRHRG